jgi:hypothetical protein
MINLEQIGPTRVAADLAKGGAKITVLSREAGFQISGVLPTRQAAEPIVGLWRNNGCGNWRFGITKENYLGFDEQRIESMRFKQFYQEVVYVSRKLSVTVATKANYKIVDTQHN